MFRWFVKYVRRIDIFGVGVEFNPQTDPPGPASHGVSDGSGATQIRKRGFEGGHPTVPAHDPTPTAELHADSKPMHQRDPTGPPSPVNELWHAKDERPWIDALERYERFIKPADAELIRELEPLNIQKIRALDAKGWYDFLYDKYFRWKYTAKNRLVTTRQSLQGYVEDGRLEDLYEIKKALLNLPKDKIEEGLRIAHSIRGLGIPGASGLLALMYPESFATVDQFVVKALRAVRDLPEAKLLTRMNPDALKPADGLVLIRIMREKAAENNRRFETATWTPRKIDKILWTYGG